MGTAFAEVKAGDLRVKKLWSDEIVRIRLGLECLVRTRDRARREQFDWLPRCILTPPNLPVRMPPFRVAS